MSRSPVNKSFLHDFILPNSKYIDIYYCISTGYVIALYILMIIGTILHFKKGKFDNITLLQCSLLGIWLFLLLWESRSRYLVNYVPLMVTFAVYSLYLIRNKKIVFKL